MGRSGDSSRTFRLDIAPAAAPDAQPRRVAPDAPPAHIPIPVEASNYERLLDSVYDAVLLATRDGVIQECNTRAVDFLAIPADSIRGARLRDFISGADSTLMESVWSNACRHRHTLIEAHCVRADGSMFPAEIAVSRVDMGEGRDLCFFIRDVTLRRQAEDSRERAMARLEEQDQVRSQFVANVSHELRTPLTSMIYAVGNLLRGVAGTLPERVREYVEMLDGDCKRLLSTVTDILDLRQIDRQSLTLTRTRVPLAPLVLKAVEALRVQARQKRVSLELDPGVRWWFVDCDVAKMERVVINLVGNAIKFTPEHGLIDMAVELDPQRTGYVLFSVKDSGIGIPPNEIDKVTQRYYTVGPQPVGAGLGLAIAREIVDLHGGSLQIESPVPGRTCGTAVRVSLPLVEPAQLLVVSANAAIRDRVEDEFSIHGYRVRAAD